MIGDFQDISRRIGLTLPVRWFADTPPVLQGLLAGISVAWATLYSLLQTVKLQTRIATSTTEFLDLISSDFFGSKLPRAPGEVDDAFRLRLQQRMHRLRGTRAALISAAADAGCMVHVFEPARIADTGAYSTAGAVAWGVAGGWGSLAMPLECLVTAELGTGADLDWLRAEIVDVLPAGGVAWTRISA